MTDKNNEQRSYEDKMQIRSAVYDVQSIMYYAFGGPSAQALGAARVIGGRRQRI
jgi:hypothetical protein